MLFWTEAQRRQARDRADHIQDVAAAVTGGKGARELRAALLKAARG